MVSFMTPMSDYVCELKQNRLMIFSFALGLTIGLNCHYLFYRHHNYRFEHRVRSSTEREKRILSSLHSSNLIGT